MSASTGTIRRPMAGGSIFGAVAIGAVTLIAALGMAWGALNLTATKHVATPVAAPTYLDRGGRSDTLAKPAAVPTYVEHDWYGVGPAAPHSQVQTKPFVGDSIVSKPDPGTPRKTHSTHPRHAGPSL